MDVAKPFAFENDGLRLRDFRADDLANVDRIMNDSTVSSTLAAASPSFDAQRFLDERLSAAASPTRTDYYLVVENLANDEFIGFVRIGLPEKGLGRLGVAIRSDRWRKGWAMRACSAVMVWAAHNCGVERFDAATAPDNKAAKQLLNKLGFEYIGRTTDFEGAMGKLRMVYERPGR